MWAPGLGNKGLRFVSTLADFAETFIMIVPLPYYYSPPQRPRAGPRFAPTAPETNLITEFIP